MLQEAPTTFYRFADYEVDSVRRILLRNGERVALTPKAFDVLLALVERHGGIVTKDELLRAVWPDTVVEEISLTRNISVLRKTLGETPDQHNFIVTVPGTGYRFVAPVDTAVPPAAKRRRWAWGVPVLILAITAATWYFRPASAPNVWRPVPLTSYPGIERSPALSPEGTEVAFTWNGEQQNNADIYVKAIGPGIPRRLTTNPAQDVSPAWSPDGRTIAFLRRFSSDRSELLLIPALGGPERKLAETRCDFPYSLAWSPDGHWLVTSHREREDQPEGLFLISVQSGEKHRLTQPPKGHFGDYMPAFSPDGRTLAFCRHPGYEVSDLYLLSLAADAQPAGEPRRLTTENQLAVSPVWTRDGSHILYVFGHNLGGRELRKIAARAPGGSERVHSFDNHVFQLSLGRPLVYSVETGDLNIGRAEIPSAGGPPTVPRPLISSTRQDWQPRYSPDGKKIAFGSDRSGAREIWTAEADGSNPVQLTFFRGPIAGFMNWSPDGRQIIFHARLEGQSDLFTIPSSGGAPKRLTEHPSDDLTPSYSHDGHWIYFSSRRSGRLDVWRMPAEGGDAVQMTRSDGGWMPLESPDGKMLYYCHEIPAKGIWKVPVEGGAAGPVTDSYGPWAFAVVAEGIYYAAARVSHKRAEIRFFNFSSGRSQPVVESDRPFGMGLSVSADQRSVIFTQSDQAGSDLMLIENFLVR